MKTVEGEPSCCDSAATGREDAVIGGDEWVSGTAVSGTADEVSQTTGT